MSVFVKSLYFSYGKNEVLKDINFSINKGDCLAILGANGVGKSTLLKCINGINMINQGEIFLENQNIKEMNLKTLAKKVAYVSQINNYTSMSVFDTVLMGRIPHIKWDLTKKDLLITQKTIDILKLNSYAGKNINHLSGGQQQVVAIGRALTQETPVLLLDEPTSNLDLKNQLEIINIIKEIVEKKEKALIVSIHDINLSVQFANKYMLIKNGRILALGGKEVLTEKNIKEAYDVDMSIQYINNQMVLLPKQNNGEK